MEPARRSQIMLVLVLGATAVEKVGCQIPNIPQFPPQALGGIGGGVPHLPGVTGVNGGPQLPPDVSSIFGTVGSPTLPGADGLPEAPDTNGLPAPPVVDGLTVPPDIDELPAPPHADGVIVPDADELLASPDATADGLPAPDAVDLPSPPVAAGFPTLPGAAGLPALPGTGVSPLPAVPGLPQPPRLPRLPTVGAQVPGAGQPVRPRTTPVQPAFTPIVNHQAAGFNQMASAFRRLNQQIAAIRNQLATVDGLSAAGVSLLQFQTTPSVIRQGMRAIRNLQRAANRISRGQQLAVAELIYPPAILTVLRGAGTQPTDGNGGRPQRSGCAPLPRPPCRPGPYRTIDGTCNNRANSLWGSAGTPLIRIHRSTYLDGILRPRTSGVDGTALPSARLVSSRCVSVREDVDSRLYTLSVMQWGQFLDHDITHVPVQRLNSTSGLDCCTRGVAKSRVRQVPECFPISVPADDPFYRQHGVRCLNFLRSIPALGQSCLNEPAQQLNQITHWIDGSNVYGSGAAELAELRRDRSRRLQLSKSGRLPRMPHGAEGCVENAGNGVCYRAGDSRVNEQISLTVTHNVWAIMHNRIADRLKRLNPAASEEHVFQEARAVNVALMQKITYSEWLPIVLGPSLTRRLGLDRRVRYNAALHPGIVNEFATAAFRFGHSLVAGAVRVPGRSVRLSDVFFNPGSRLERRGMSAAVVRSLVRQPAQAMDTTFSREIVGRLFRGRSQHGLDLVALNIQRGRDHGIASYVQTRAALSAACPSLARPVNSWAQLGAVMAPRAVAQLRSVYRSPADIDLFIGGVSEYRAAEGLVGPTFQCILAEQFVRLKYGDRHFYNHFGSMFTDAQLSAITAASWASVLCETFPQVGSVQPNAFLRSSGRPVSCRRMPRLNLAAWSRVLPRH